MNDYQNKDYHINNSIIYVALFPWLGILSTNISLRLGGIAFVFVDIFLLCLALYPGVIYFSSEKQLLTRGYALFILFSIIYALGSLLYKSGHFTMLSSIEIPVYMYNIIICLPMWISSFLLVIKGNQYHYYKYTKLLYFILLYDVLITLYVLISNPLFSKYSSTGVLSVAEEFRYLGAMGYELTYSLAILIPLFIVLSKWEKKWIVLVALSIVLVIKSSFLIAIVALLLNLGISQILKISNRIIKYLLVFVCIVIVVYLGFNASLLGKGLISISSSINSVELQRRFAQLGELFLYGNNSGDSLARFELYQQSVKGIADSPFLGQLLFDSHYAISDHSTLIDVWSAFGIVPELLLIGSIVRIAKYSISLLNSRNLKNVVMTSYGTLIFIGIFNQILMSSQIVISAFVLIPIFCNLINYYEIDAF